MPPPPDPSPATPPPTPDATTDTRTETDTGTGTEDAVVALAADVARRTVDDLRPRLLAGAGSRSHDKGDGSPVTDVDLAVDAHLVDMVADAFPGHGVISEEGRTTWDGSDWTWIIDPIDGTTNYAAGLPWWCVSIALAHRGEVAWGMVDAPTLDRRWEAWRGGPTTLNGEVVHVAAAPNLSDRCSRHEPIAVTPGTIRRWRRGTFFKARVVGSSALELALVADGSLAAAYQRVPKVWDVAAGLALVTSAGGAVVAVEDTGHFPLRTDNDYRDDSMVTAAGASEPWCRDLADRLWPRD